MQCEGNEKSIMGQKRISFSPVKLRIPLLVVLGFCLICTLYLWQTAGLTKLQENRFLLSNETETLQLACPYPDTDPFNPEIRKMYETQKTLKCTGAPPLTFLKKRDIFVNKTRVKALYSGQFEMCNYREVYRPDSDDNVSFSDWKNNFTDKISVNETVEFVHVVCMDKNGTHISQAYHGLFLNDNNTEIDLDVKLKKRNATMTPDETLNVMMIGLDGISRNQIIRDLPKTYSFLTKELQGFDMEMYSQTGVNTFPNYLSLLGGQLYSEVMKWWYKDYHVDALDLVWDRYKESGYRTLSTEDFPTLGAFNYLKKGFMYKPVQYYSRPLIIAIEKDKSIMNTDNLCVGDEPVMTFHLNYVRDFAMTYRKKPYFAFHFYTRLTHDVVERASMIDDHVHASLERLFKEELLNNTLLIFFSDHGPRWGKIYSTYQGSIEGRSPIAVFAFPQWFVKKYPDLFETFRKNTKRLTTHFDTHATLLDMLNFKREGPRVSTRHGQSLFQEISPSRTCETVSIPREFCLCGESSDNIIDNNSTLVSKLGAAIVKKINDKRIKEKCAELSVDKIINVYKMNLKFETKNQTLQYKVTLQTKPGAAQYQATVLQNVKTSELNVGSNIIRVNMYRGTAECVDDAQIRPFCYCLNLKDKS